MKFCVANIAFFSHLLHTEDLVCKALLSDPHVTLMTDYIMKVFCLCVSSITAKM